MAAITMAGRGRGIFRRVDDKPFEPLRRPGAMQQITTPPVTPPKDLSPNIPSDLYFSNENFSESSNKNDLSGIEKLTNFNLHTGSLEDRLLILGLSGQDPGVLPKVPTVANIIKEQIRSEDDLKEVIRVLIHYGTLGKQQSCIAAQLVKHLRAFRYENLKFLVDYMNQLQKFFEGRNVEEKSFFTDYLTLLCDSFYHLGLEGSNPIQFVKKIILSFFDKLLSARRDDLAISTVLELILKLCYDLDMQETSNLMKTVRKCIVSRECSEISRSRLLHILELYLNNWKALDKDIDQFYVSVLRR